MICYRDMAFCGSDCMNEACARHRVHTTGNTQELPVAWEDFRSSCKEYMNPADEGMYTIEGAPLLMRRITGGRKVSPSGLVDELREGDFFVLNGAWHARVHEGVLTVLETGHRSPCGAVRWVTECPEGMEPYWAPSRRDGYDSPFPDDETDDVPF